MKLSCDVSSVVKTPSQAILNIGIEETEKLKQCSDELEDVRFDFQEFRVSETIEFIILFVTGTSHITG